MMTRCLALFVILAAALTPDLILGAVIGQPAPPLVIKEWIKGPPMAVNTGTNILVVEIWSITSPSSRACVTNLNNIQSWFKTNGVVVIGVSDDPPDAIKKYLANEVTNIDYEIAADDQRQTASHYMTSVKQRNVPYAFVVGTNGNVLWHGRPVNTLSGVMAQIVAGQYDVERASKNEIATHQMEQYLELARKDDFRAKPAGLALLANRTNDVELLCDMAYVIATAPAVPNRNFALADQALDQADSLATTNKAGVKMVRAICLFESGKRDAGLNMATQALESAQSPLVKANIQILLHVMEARLAKKQNQESKTNRVQTSRAPKPADAAGTNQSSQITGKAPATAP